MSEGILPMKPLAPIVDRMRVIAREELPKPRSCKVQLWDDGTFDARFYHTMGKQERQYIIYNRVTSEIVWIYCKGGGWESHSVTADETIHEPVVDEIDARVIETVDPPYSSES
jgi:hypothetical protein